VRKLGKSGKKQGDRDEKTPKVKSRGIDADNGSQPFSVCPLTFLVEI